MTRDTIRDALAAVDVDVEHIGSTAVPGLAAKPIIDVVVAVDDITAEEDYLDALLAEGASRAESIAAATLQRTYDRVGFLPAKR